MNQNPQFKKLKHPPALPMLFFTEMWERFGFYIVQATLVLYLIGDFHFSDDKSYAMFGGFTAYIYISPIIGGYLANTLLGYRRAIILGGILLCLGYSVLGVLGEPYFEVALAIIITGNAFFKPNISSLLGDLYEPGDQHRDSGFTLFYIGINVGSLLAMGNAGFVQQYFGWHVTFFMAGFGLLIGVSSFIFWIKKN